MKRAFSRSCFSWLTSILVAALVTFASFNTAKADPTDAQFQALALALSNHITQGHCGATVNCSNNVATLRVKYGSCKACLDKLDELEEQIGRLPKQTAEATVDLMEEKFGATWRELAESAGGECTAMVRMVIKAPPTAGISASVIEAIRGCGDRAKARQEKAIGACQENGGVVVDGSFAMICEKPDHDGRAAVIKAGAYEKVELARITAEASLGHNQLTLASHALDLNGGGTLDLNGGALQLNDPTLTDNGYSLNVGERSKLPGWAKGLIVVGTVLAAGALTAGLVCGLTEKCTNTKETIRIEQAPPAAFLSR